jgi:SAM-dependent methyltransferase
VSKPVVDIEAGRAAFGEDPAAYERARPAYPEAIFDILRERCGLAPGIAAFEVGPGPGVVTERLAGAGVRQITAVEPDARLAGHLRRRLAGRLDLSIIETIFEDAELPPAAFDLGVAATSFHWVDQKAGIAKVADALKPGGWWACWWNLFSDGARTDPFMRATAPLFRDVPRPHSGGDADFELNTAARLADLGAEPRLHNAEAEIFRWTVTLSADEVRDLYATFSPVIVLAPEARRRFLDAIHAIAAGEFGNRVEKPMAAALYTSQRR